jgi:hypothetical protein
MSKGYSGLFNGTKGTFIKTDGLNNINSEIFLRLLSMFTKEGTLIEKALLENIGLFEHINFDNFVKILEKLGYELEICDSIRSKSGAIIVKVKNISKEKNISQVQLSPGGGRHGPAAYMKISTIDIGKFKIVKGTSLDYIGNGAETAKIIFVGGLK